MGQKPNKQKKQFHQQTAKEIGNVTYELLPGNFHKEDAYKGMYVLSG